MIDPHAHCRDGKQTYKETINHTFEIANKQGVKKIFDMPNTEPAILLEKDVIARMSNVPQERKNDYYLYIGATSNPEQLKEAVRCWKNYKQVIGIKLFAGKSVGPLGVTTIQEQKAVYETLTNAQYTGVLAVHCEKEALLHPEIWNPKMPITHCYARPKAAEIESVKDQIRIARETGFRGTLHICHVSCWESIEIINEARKSIKITCGVTPHHLLWDETAMASKEGLIYKMNPPLRDKFTVEKLRANLIAGKIDWIETDHAPHAIGEKLFPPHLSGYPSLYLYKYLIEEALPKMGATEKLIRKMTSERITEVFGEKLN